MRSVRIAAGLDPLLACLRGLGVVPTVDEPALSDGELLLERCRKHLLIERGVSAANARARTANDAGAQLYRLRSPTRLRARVNESARSRRADVAGRDGFVLADWGSS